MSTPNAEIPAPASQPSGDLQQPGQLPNTPVAQPNQPSPTQPASPQAPAAPPNAEIETLRKELERERNAARHFQSNFDRAQQQIQALSGVAPRQDPLAEDVAFLKQKGYPEENARDIAEFMNRKLEPLQQHNMQLQASMRGTITAQQAYQDAAAADPGLFADPKIGQAAWESLNAAAQAGRLEYITPGYAKHVAATAYAMEKQPWNQAPQQPPAPQPMQGFRPAGLPPISFGGPPSGYPPQHFQQQPTGPSAEANKLAAEMGAYLGIPPKQ